MQNGKQSNITDKEKIMLKSQAIRELINGKKCRESNWVWSEYIYWDGAIFRDQDGDVFDINMTDSSDWEIYFEVEHEFKNSGLPSLIEENQRGNTFRRVIIMEEKLNEIIKYLHNSE